MSCVNQVSNQVSNEVSEETRDQACSIINIAVHEKVIDILNFVQNYTKSKEILEGIGLTNQTKNRKKYLDSLIEYGWIGMLNPEVKTDPTQMYKITVTGRRLLNLLSV